MRAVTVSLAVILTVSPGGAGIVAYSGDLELISRPASVVRGSLVSDINARVFAENVFYVLPKETYVDIQWPGLFDQAKKVRASGGVLLEDSAVNSYLVHANAVSTCVVFEGVLTFSEPVLALIVRSRTLRSTDGTLGAVDVAYPRSSSGLELSPARDWIALSEDRHTVRWHLVTHRGIDHIRILEKAEPEEPTPEPSTWILAGMGLCAQVIIRCLLR